MKAALQNYQARMRWVLDQPTASNALDSLPVLAQAWKVAGH